MGWWKIIYLVYLLFILLLGGKRALLVEDFYAATILLYLEMCAVGCCTQGQKRFIQFNC